MRVLVTGGAGYIGSVLIRRLIKEGHRVKVLDNLMFGGESLLGIYQEPNFQFIQGDIRDKKVLTKALNNIGFLVHLAALVGHPLCHSQPQWTEEINYKATGLLLEKAISLGIKRFVFTSTCSNYGINNSKALAREDSLLKPLSEYAKTKVKAERYIMTLPKKKGFNTCILRLGTIFGLSPRMRFDLLINELVRDALLKKKVTIQSPYAWRPFLHVQDAAGAIITCLQAQSKQIAGEVFNVGCGNYQKKQIAEIVKRHIPDTAIEVLERAEDGRDYKVSFEKIREKIGFKNKFNLDKGILEIKEAIEKGIIDCPESVKYTNLRYKNV